MNFDDLLEKYRKLSFSQRDKGDKFERLMQAFLRTDPKYSHLFKEVWLWKDFFGRSELGGSDTGIDLVAQTIDDEYWAIQCKCFQESDIIGKGEVDSFLATSSRTFKDENLQRTGFAQRLWISTTNRWGSNAEKAVENQNPPFTRINLTDLRESRVDWEKIENGIHGESALQEKKTLRDHQKEAVDKTHEYFKNADRGKLIMACGTGKTYTALKIAEKETNGKGTILFLVPSIALLGQTLREWFADADETLSAVCICSDAEISKQRTRRDDGEFDNVIDLAYPASTKPNAVVDQFRLFQRRKAEGMTVVFSTYHSIDVVAKAQKKLLENNFPEFDLIICDEAHRTTGVTLAGEDESAFTKIHNNDFIKAKKRLYMTATPRLFSDDAKGKAAQADAELCSMDDPNLYGEEIYRIGFGEAVERGLLTDYKVLILTLSEYDVPPAVQAAISDEKKEINSDDASKLIGCINALSKQILGDDGVLQRDDPDFMKRAVAFCPKIVDSKKITNVFNDFGQVYTGSFNGTNADTKGVQMVHVSSDHIDGTMSAPERDRKLGWLKEDTPVGECRILTNVRCLSEGVDVPSLDAVMFLAARNSPVDVVQSVGRVMRRSPGKKYGYIIIPIVVPSNIEPHEALNDNERYKVVWTVLNALRAHDDRFNATVNKIELNKNKPNNILIGKPEVEFRNGEPVLADPDKASEENREVSRQLQLQFEELKGAVFAKMVQKVGERQYWEQWAKDVAEIAQKQEARIKKLIAENERHRKAFDKFLKGLQKNINPSISEQEAIDMLSQHVVTQPVFEALFEDYSFVQNNAVSKSMQAMLDLLEAQAIEKDTETLQKFYDSVKKRASGIDNAEAKQRIIVELYDKFFKTAFPKMVERLGIVYTPVEVVDFIVNSVNDILKQEFGRTLSDENVNILDPFTGTGTFITRLLQSGHIKPEDLERKYRKEIFANEIVLLAYYIAAVNIENAFHDAISNGTRKPSPASAEPRPNELFETRDDASYGAEGESVRKSHYIPFDGICLTDTFQLSEPANEDDLYSAEFPQNSKRVLRQKKTPLTVILGNPPYSIGQRAANDDAQNRSYTNLDRRISTTYANASSAGLNKALYDPYIRAIRWSTDRISPENGGVIAFVTNSGWLTGNGTDGFRMSLEKEFSRICVLNLRGAIRGRSGDIAKREGQNVFDIMTGVSIMLLIKNPTSKKGNATIYYRDVGDYLSRKAKFQFLSSAGSVAGGAIKFEKVDPNEHGDWINKRTALGVKFFPLEPEKKYELTSSSVFLTYSLGLGTNRDSWCYNSSRTSLVGNINRGIEFYNTERIRYLNLSQSNGATRPEDVVHYDSTQGTWTDRWINDLRNGISYAFAADALRTAIYRPFFKQNVYFSTKFNHRVYQQPKLFPKRSTENLVITLPGKGERRGFATLITNSLIDLNAYDGGTQCFPLYYYEEKKKDNPTLFDKPGEPELVRRDGISDFILERARGQYGNIVKKEDIFYYVYGFLHSPEYRETFANDLKKLLPRLPLVEKTEDFWAFSKAGRKLADLHINYESVPPHPDVILSEPPPSGGGQSDEQANRPPAHAGGSDLYRVEKMKFAKMDGEVNGKKKKVDDRSTIIYNSRITVSNIPPKAYEYVVNGRSAIEWIMERYQIKKDKASGITNDPNDWSKEVGNPRYILDLLLSIVNVSTQTVDIVNGLPKMKFE